MKTTILVIVILLSSVLLCIPIKAQSIQIDCDQSVAWAKEYFTFRFAEIDSALNQMDHSSLSRNTQLYRMVCYCYGTLAEIGYAYAKRKLIWIAYSHKINSNMWFIDRLADKVGVSKSPEILYKKWRSEMGW